MISDPDPADAAKRTYTLPEVMELLAQVRGAVDRAWDSPSGKTFRERLGEAIDRMGAQQVSERLRQATERLRAEAERRR